MNLSQLDQAIRAAGIPIHGLSPGPPVRIDFQAAATGPQQTAAQAIVDGWNSTAPAETARDLAALKVQAKAQLDTAVDAGARAAKAIVILTVDEINALRQWITAFKAATAAATTLADLKVRVAALANLPDRTNAQAKTAMNATIDAQT